MRSLLHVCMPPDNTISILRIWKIAIVSAIAFGVGYACMAMLNGGDMAGAKPKFETYLKLAPTGQYAETAKSVIASIK